MKPFPPMRRMRMGPSNHHKKLRALPENSEAIEVWGREFTYLRAAAERVITFCRAPANVAATEDQLYFSWTTVLAAAPSCFRRLESPSRETTDCANASGVSA